MDLVFDLSLAIHATRNLPFKAFRWPTTWFVWHVTTTCHAWLHMLTPPDIPLDCISKLGEALSLGYFLAFSYGYWALRIETNQFIVDECPNPRIVIDMKVENCISAECRSGGAENSPMLWSFYLSRNKDEPKTRALGIREEVKTIW